MNKPRVTVPVEMAGYGKVKRTPICLSRSCPLNRECSQHTTAGDFRSEDGFTPNLLREKDGTWTCDQMETMCSGMLVWSRNRNRNRYEPYDLYDETQ